MKNRKAKFKRKLIKIPIKVLFLLFLFFLSLVYSKKTAYFILSRLPYFKLSEVFVKDQFILNGEESLKFTGLKKGTNIFEINISSLAKEIKDRHPEYEDIVVKRILPKRIIVLLKERKPLIQIKMVEYYPVDRNGFVIPRKKKEPYAGLPVIIGIEPEEVVVNRFSHSLKIKKAIELMDLVKKYPWVGKISKINLASINDISLFFDDGLEVKLGSHIREEKFGLLSEVLEDLERRSLSPAFVDLRFKDVVIGPK